MPRGAISASLATLLMLSGCNSLPVRVQAPVAPPVQYMQECTEPVRPAELTNGLLVRYAKDVRDTLRICNQDKASLREWAESITKSN